MVRSSLLLKISCYPTIYQTSFINAGKREWLITITLLAKLEGQIALIYVTPHLFVTCLLLTLPSVRSRNGRGEQRNGDRKGKANPNQRTGKPAAVSDRDHCDNTKRDDRARKGQSQSLHPPDLSRSNGSCFY